MQGKSSKAGVVLVIVLIMFLVTAVFLTFRDRRNREAFEPKDVHLRVYAFGPVSEENYFDEVLAAYQKSHDNVSIEHRVVPLPPPTYQTGEFVAGYEYLLLADFSAQDPPDVFVLNTGRIAAYLDNGALLDLAPYLPEDYKTANGLPLDGPIYSLPFYTYVDLVAAFSTKHPQETVDLLRYLSTNRVERERRLAEEAKARAEELARSGAGILDVTDDQFFLNLWNNLAFSIGNKDIQLDESAKDGNDYLISHEFAYGYPYLVLRFSTDSETGLRQVVLVINDQYLENPTLARNMSDGVIVLIRSIHKDIGEEETKAILEDLGILKSESPLAVDIGLIAEPKSTVFGSYEFSTLKDPLARAIRVRKLEN